MNLQNVLLIIIKGSALSNKKAVTFWGITVDNKLSFEPHLNLVCKNVSQNVCTFARVSILFSQKILRFIMGVFILS